jgi:hypothetical protein
MKFCQGLRLLQSRLIAQDQFIFVDYQIERYPSNPVGMLWPIGWRRQPVVAVVLRLSGGLVDDVERILASHKLPIPVRSLQTTSLSSLAALPPGEYALVL